MESTKEEIHDDTAYCSDEALTAARNAFGISYLYPWQRLVIANILDAVCWPESIKAEDAVYRGRQIVLLPTGAGKSLCFLVPALLLTGPTLVIYPLLALMADQQRRMDEGGLTSVTFRGGQSPEEREENFRKIKAGTKIILANPEVLQNKQLIERLSHCGIQHAAIDEAHCVSEWGDSFRPAYLTLGKILENLKVPVITAFTATASPAVLERLAEVLFNGETHIVRSESDRPNIHYFVKHVCAKKQEAVLLARTQKRPMIIFCGTRAHAEDMSRELNTCYGKETARFYHAGLEKNEKAEIEKWFFNKTDAILCATCAYGMGVDKKDIHTVIHLDTPETAESYIQEAGRGGRDGSVAKAILLWSPLDSIKFSAFPKDSRAYKMKEFAETGNCRRQVLLEALGAEQTVCSGCDLCDARRDILSPNKLKSEFLKENDEKIVTDFIRNHRKLYTKIELERMLLPILNKKSRTVCGFNIWQHSSIADILYQLERSGKIRTCPWPWKNKVTSAREPILQAHLKSAPVHSRQRKIQPLLFHYQQKRKKA
jgi:ATP-dependent DNA helicase RecQ